MSGERRNSKGKLLANLIGRIDVALQNRFFLEASWIEYSIIEDRLLSVIKKADARNPGNGFKVDKCLKRIKHLRDKEKQDLIVKHFSSDLLENITNWKNNRNTTMHDLAKKHITEKRIENLAVEGQELMRKLNSTVMRYKRDWQKIKK